MRLKSMDRSIMAAERIPSGMSPFPDSGRSGLEGGGGPYHLKAAVPFWNVAPSFNSKATDAYHLEREFFRLNENLLTSVWRFVELR